MPEALPTMTAPPANSGPEPLSRSLARVIEAGGAGGVLTVNQLLTHTDGRGIYLVLVLLSLPFVAWVSVPGMSTVCGPVIGLLAWRLARGKAPRLPAVLGDRALPPRLKRVILGGGLKFCRLLERGVRPRRTAWMARRLSVTVHALLLALMALLLALPLPSPPFIGSNTLPSYAILLLAVSMMEGDGVMIFAGYLAALVAAGYFVVLGGVIVTHLAGWFAALFRLLEIAQ